MKVYPSLILHANANGQALGGYRAWHVARDWELGGTGFIPGAIFKKYLKNLGLARSTYSRWIRQAYSLGLFQRAGRGFIKLAGLEAAGKLARCPEIERPAEIPLEQLTGEGWASFVWAGFIGNHDGLIARATLQELSGGVPERTQYHWERMAGVENHANYASRGKVKDNPELAVQLYDQPGYFMEAGEIKRQLPNSRTVPECVQQANKGRIKTVNPKLAESYGETASGNGRVYRLYSDNYKLTKRIKRQNKASDDRSIPAVIYERTRQGNYYAITL